MFYINSFKQTYRNGYLEYFIYFLFRVSKIMAQNRFIRPLSTQYHDITEQRIEERFEDIPFKFKSNLQHEEYVKKPKFVQQYIQPIPAVLPPLPQQTGCQKCCHFCFPCCKQNTQPYIHQQTFCEYISQNFCAGKQPVEQDKPGRCCIRSFQPELCSNCVNKLCPQCYNSLCLKFRMCSDCKNKMCPTCRQNLFCVPSVKIRDYPIKIKNKNGLHFENCQCPHCRDFNPSRASFQPQPNNFQPQRINAGNEGMMIQNPNNINQNSIVGPVIGNIIQNNRFDQSSVITYANPNPTPNPNNQVPSFLNQNLNPKFQNNQVPPMLNENLNPKFENNQVPSFLNQNLNPKFENNQGYMNMSNNMRPNGDQLIFN